MSQQSDTRMLCPSQGWEVDQGETLMEPLEEGVSFSRELEAGVRSYQFKCTDDTHWGGSEDAGENRPSRP